MGLCRRGCHRSEKRLQKRCRSSRSHRYRIAIVLYPRFCCRRPQSRSGTRKPGCHAVARRNKMFRFPGRTRIVRCRRRRYQNRSQSRQSTERTVALHLERSGKRCRSNHLPYQRIYLRANTIRLLYGRIESGS